MIKNYLKVAFRSIFRNKLTAFINIAGLALAIACVILIYLFIADEITYDQYHAKSDRIYRITRNFHSPEGEVSLHLATVAPPIGPLIKNDFGELEYVARTATFDIVVSLEENGNLVQSNTEQRAFLAEPDIFKIFDIEVITGNPSSAISRPFTVMLSENTAKRYFNSNEVVGKRLRVNNAFDLEVTGVYKNFPRQSHWHPEFLMSFSTLESDEIFGRRNLETGWGNNSFGTYVLLEEGASPTKLEAALPAFINKHFGAFARENWGQSADWDASSSTTLFVQKVTDIHLHSHLDNEIEPNGNINNVYMMAIIGLFIVLIACFNFVNLSTARATKRAKEVGLRKVVGAFRSQLVNQYLSESILTTIFALVLAIAISFIAIDTLNAFTNKQLTLDFIGNPLLGIGVVAFAILVGILAGIYPAFVISSYKPAVTLKGKQGTTPGKGTLRKGLVVSQFMISTVLIIATIVIFQQLNYLNSRDLGYDKEQVITMPYYSEVNNNYDAFYNELTRNSAVINVSRSSRVPTGRLLDSYGSTRALKGDSLVHISSDFKTITTDPEFFNTYGIGVTLGRAFSKEIATDDSLAFIINKAALKEIGWENPIDYIDREFEYAGVRGKLVGVVEDFHFESLHQQIRPMIFLQRDNYKVLSLKVDQSRMQEGIAHIEKVWKQFLTEKPFEYQFISERYRALYENEQKQSQLFTTFSLLAIFIASLGLFGLATFNTMQRIKEIGIRKVLGASVGDILTLLSKEIVILIIVANAIAWPIAWYFMSQWLETFAYHIEMSLMVYAIAAISALIVALITVSSQTVKAALSNPAGTLRYE